LKYPLIDPVSVLSCRCFAGEAFEGPTNCGTLPIILPHGQL